MFVGMGANSGGAYNLESSLRFRSSASAYLERTPTSTGDRQKFTVSLWVKRGELGVTTRLLFQQREDVNSSQQFNISFRSDDAIRIIDQNGGATVGYIDTNPVYRDTASWYHIVVVRDSTNATADDRTKLYINGERVTSFLASSNVALNYSSSTNTTDRILIGCQRPNSSATLGNFYDGYMTEFNLVDGQALTADDFGEYDDTTGVWKPKEYTGTYGTNGFYLPMKETQQATGFNTVLYTGNGTSQSITGVGFEPDFVWLKERSSTSSHFLNQAVDGTVRFMQSDTTIAEVTNAQVVGSFDSDGFSVGNSGGSNQSGVDYVAWCWDAGSSTVSNTDGTITSSVRANPATGFSIVTYTGNGTNGSTIGHGLGVAPKMVIYKNRSATGVWLVLGYPEFSSVFTANNSYLQLDSTQAIGTAGTIGATHGASTITINNSGSNINASGNNYVAYCFAEVAGYSKFGSYTGTGATGNTITTGFRPAFVMIKRTDSIGNWIMIDNTRSVNNPKSQWLNANTSDAEGTSSASDIDFDDNGFTLQNTNADRNGSGNSYIYMAFADTRDAQFNFDASGNKNNWTANNINSNASSETTYDIMNDVPTLTDEDTSNFATLNPLGPSGLVTNRATVELLDGNLTNSDTANIGFFGLSYSTIQMNTGKFYFECISSWDASSAVLVGVLGDEVIDHLGRAPATVAYVNDGTKMVNTTFSAYGSSFVANDVIGVAFDADAQTIEFYKNNVGQGSISVGNSSLGGYRFYVSVGWSSGSKPYNYVNFGQRPFKYTPPTGYKKLNTFNLPDSSITDGSQYMNPVLWTGDGSTTRDITGFGFTPDLVWTKKRSVAGNNYLFDSIRGDNKVLISDSTNAELVPSAFTGGGPNGIIEDGFDIISGTSNANNINANGATFVGWGWKGSDSTAVSNTDGTITSTVSANTDSGFSVVTYTGNGSTNQTVGHGLGITPKVIIYKNRDSATAWRVIPAFLNDGYYLALNDTSAMVTASTSYFGTNTSTTLGISGSNSGIINPSGNNMVAYAFAEVGGFSKFGSYTGNGSTDGPFVYTGFRPAFVLYKRTDTTGNWRVQDTARDTNNDGSSYELFPNLTNAEASSARMDILSNGFKCITTSADTNASGGTYIYMAFAENPMKHSLAR
jgi:hypothetical protein